MTTDTIADTLTRIRNAQLAGHKSVKVSASKMTKSVLEVLKSEGFIDGFETVKSEDKPCDECNVFLKYYENGLPVISVAKRASKPGRRFYLRATELPKVSSGLGISIISTSQGVLSDREARKKKIGGEIVAKIG